MASNARNNPKDRDDKHNQFVGPIVYKNEVPGPALDCKILPCGQDILVYTEKPMPLAKHEPPFSHHFRGLHELFDFDLLDQSVYDRQPKSGQQMDPRDAALLADIEPLTFGYSKPRPSRAQECAQMFPKERDQVPRPRPGVKPSVPEVNAQKTLLPLSLGQQRDLIDSTFEEIKKPLLKHPTKPGSKARPLTILPVFPDTDLQNYSFVEMKFDIPPNENSQNLIKDFGHYLVNFSIEQSEAGEKFYLSDQRYKEDKAPENFERGERFILRERGEALHYVSVDKHIKLRRERPRPQAMTNKCLLQVKQVAMEAK
ncbi:uncharacterized protein LOC119546482 isoform X2 [Drosophila subpulchrella]|uniref:uncharacterized protein LOC119546482 isoform X2 n=1 Tax=Drosophila subpulchrella TaxID=1486046 RepID=UPI0018A15020|nr:uncharacterized protein LOC119546482 isoform X2 [Drosophila subpulchrella]